MINGYLPVSYDLIFWRQRAGDNRRPGEIAKALTDGKPVSGLDLLPIEEIVARVHDRFPLTTSGGLTYWEGAADGMFELYHSVQHVHVCCRQLVDDHCNTLIDIMADFQCPLYDPQVNHRFDGGTAGA